MALWVYSTSGMNRRRYLATAGSAASALLAGCTEALSDSSSDDEETPETGDDDTGLTDEADGQSDDSQSGADDTDDGADSADDGENDDSSNETDDEQTELDLDLSTPEAAIESYLLAANEEDEEATVEVMHSDNPLNPEQLDGLGFSFEPFDTVDPAAVDVVETDEDTALDDVLELEQAEFWFEESDPVDEIDSDETAFVTVETGEGELDNELDTWVLATEDDGWRVLFIGTEEIPEPDPEEVFEEPIDDDDDDVVESVEWDVEPYVDDFETDDPLVEVQLTESPGIEAHTVRAETAIAGGNFELYDDNDSDLEVTWAGNSTAIAFDPEGDQVEVTAVTDDDEQVVHREQYEPSE